jgi:putative oxidoreductase
MAEVSTILRATSSHKMAGVIRIMLGLMMAMTGLMKMFVPSLGAAFAGQLAAAQIPLPELNGLLVPVVEVMVGAALLAGFYTRVAALMLAGIMIVATYVHLAVADPTLFPLQPEAPIIPLMVIPLTTLILIRGGGAWSLDLKSGSNH